MQARATEGDKRPCVCECCVAGRLCAAWCTWDSGARLWAVWAKAAHLRPREPLQGLQAVAVGALEVDLRRVGAAGGSQHAATTAHTQTPHARAFRPPAHCPAASRPGSRRRAPPLPGAPRSPLRPGGPPAPSAAAGRRTPAGRHDHGITMRRPRSAAAQPNHQVRSRQRHSVQWPRTCSTRRAPKFSAAQARGPILRPHLREHARHERRRLQHLQGHRHKKTGTYV